MGTLRRGPSHRRRSVLTGFNTGAAALAGLVSLAGPAPAQPCVPAETGRLFVPDAHGFDAFGSVVAASGFSAVVGVPLGDTGPGTNQGAVYVYAHSLEGGVNRGGWRSQAKLEPTAGLTFGDRFGEAVAIDGGVIAVGAPGDDNINGQDAGAVYVFRQGAGGVWTQEAKIVATDDPFSPSQGGPGDEFGAAVAVAGDVLLIGAPLFEPDDLPPPEPVDTGALYAFEFNGSAWVQDSHRTGLDGDQLGAEVAMTDSRVVVSSPFKDATPSIQNTGAVTFYDLIGANLESAQLVFASDRDAGDRFGEALAIAGDAAVVGAPFDDDNGSSSGSGYVFRDAGAAWSQEAKLTASDGEANERFGEAMSVAGSTAVVGVRGDSDNGTQSGSVYEYTFDGAQWNEQPKLQPSDPAADDRFGESVALGSIAFTADTILAGAPGDDDPVLSAGSVRVFRSDVTQWIEKPTLHATLGAQADMLGSAVAVAGDVAVLGAPGDDADGPGTGATHVFRFDGLAFVYESPLSLGVPPPGIGFGASVAAGPGWALVGAPEDDGTEGAAYLFFDSGGSWSPTGSVTGAAPADRLGVAAAISGDAGVVGTEAGYVLAVLHDGTGGLTTTDTLTPTGGSSGDRFGEAVAIDGDVIVIGAWGDDASGTDAGAAYIFRFDGATWNQEAKLLASDGEPSDLFGWSVAVSGDVAVVGALREGSLGSGAAYVFRFDGAAWNEEAKLVSAPRLFFEAFAQSVAVAGDLIVIGATGRGTFGDVPGAADVFRFDGAAWVRDAEVLGSEAYTTEGFGVAVALDGETALIGAANTGTNPLNIGSAYTFDLGCTPNCLADVNGDGVLTPADFTAWIAAFNAGAPGCDQNGDGNCDPTDFTAWIANFNAGC